jgi:hypothetical protein
MNDDTTFKLGILMAFFSLVVIIFVNMRINELEESFGGRYGKTSIRTAK